MKDKILELRKSGLSYNEISAILNCSKSTISYHCSKLISNDIKIKNNLNVKNKKQKKDKSFLLETSRIDEVIMLRRDKKTYSEIKYITGLSNHIISKICREFNLVNSYKFGKLSEEDINKIVILYTELRSTRKVAKATKISRDIVIKYVRKAIESKEIIEIDKGTRKQQQVKGVVEWRKRTKIKLVEYKGGKCEMCGYNKCFAALEFHHVDPKEKDFTIGGRSWSFERLKKEVDKCILVCANCHTEIHYESRITAHTEPH